MKKNGHFIVPLKKSEPVVYQVKETSLQDRLLAEFRAGKGLKARILVVAEMLKGISDLKDKVATANEVIAALNPDIVAYQRTQPSVALEAIFSRDELREAAGVPPVADEVSAAQIWLQDGVKFGPLVETIPAAKHRRALGKREPLHGAHRVEPTAGSRKLMAGEHRIVILGGGTGGTLVANRLRRSGGDSVKITVIDRDDTHVYQPGLLFVPFGLAEPGEIVRPRHAQLRSGIEFVEADVESVASAENTVRFTGGGELEYDVLVIATGARLQPEETEGLVGPEWGRSIHTFYSLAGATALRPALEEMTAGRLLVNVVDMPI